MVTGNGEQPLGQLLDKELAEKLDEAIAALPLECRTVFELSRFAGKKHAEIALELGISVNTVKYHIKHALQMLNERLGALHRDGTLAPEHTVINHNIKQETT